MQNIQQSHDAVAATERKAHVEKNEKRRILQWVSDFVHNSTEKRLHHTVRDFSVAKHLHQILVNLGLQR
jgi:hypothetical protein